MHQASFFNISLNNILTAEHSILDKARIRLLYFGLWLAFIADLALIFTSFAQASTVNTIISGFTAVLLLGLFKYLTWRPDWRRISHVLLTMVTLLNLSNVYVLVQSVSLVTIQLILITVLFSFYMLGQSFGLFYSLVNIIPVLAFMVLEYYSSYIINFKPEKVDQSLTIVSVLSNFILIIFIHSHFYGAFLKNIKQLKQTSEKQKQLNVQMEVAIQKAEKSSQAKSEFLSTMSHEIRTPLNAVIGMSNLLMMSNPRLDQKENLEILKFSANNLLAIVNDVLDFNKIESGKLIFENVRFNMGELMHNICGAQIIKAIEKGLNFSLNVDSSLKYRTIIGDPTRLTQVIFNLVSNAIKFTEKGNVWVNVNCIQDRHNVLAIHFSVKDTGIGIDKDNLSTIFEPFAQESMSTTRQYGGTGLGLSIVKRLLELQGVSMYVDTKPGVGSEFSFNMEFTVPTDVEVKKPAEQLIPVLEHPKQEQLSGNFSDVRVLIAEDNPVNVMLMKKLLSKWDITPKFAENGALAVEMVQYGNFDIILMDLQMPVMNGFEAATEIRNLADNRKSNLPIIALTASALVDIREQVFSSGMNDYVSKPFKPDELKEKMLGLLAMA
ncbi:ATP-binding protein [Mucilaginibacter sp. KACC 22063]|uniref:ATP-binding protein n=1 Tax=Mucilaginibacter sp. KACC 22063 TaxID=3025666 RepID=UPI00236684A4|nr:ATP-binding protein [Mucilaginibacter sp. KACC 22063]WDF56890.1 ATP-binding protein [Mucilaginibacter sp. KACC 22063]